MKALEHVPCAVPVTLDEALQLQADPATRGFVLAGGSDLMVQWSSGARPLPERVTNITALNELRGISVEGDVLRIGALSTHRELRQNPQVRELAPVLVAAAATVGGAQIQAMGTLGGNLVNASPAGDLTPALLVAGAVIYIASVKGTRKIPLEDFLIDYRKLDLAPDELVVAVELVPKPAAATDAFRKVGPRAAQAISKVMIASRLEREGQTVRTAAISLGSVAATAVRLHEVEELVSGQALTPALIAEAVRLTSETVHPISDIRSTAEYRKWVAGRLVGEVLEGTKGTERT